VLVMRQAVHTADRSMVTHFADVVYKLLRRHRHARGWIVAGAAAALEARGWPSGDADTAATKLADALRVASSAKETRDRLLAFRDVPLAR